MYRTFVRLIFNAGNPIDNPAFPAPMEEAEQPCRQLRRRLTAPMTEAVPVGSATSRYWRPACSKV